MNLLPNVQTIVIAGLIGVVMGALPAWRLTTTYQENKWGKAIAEQKVAAAALLQTETDKVLAYERTVNQFKDQLEKRHAASKKQIDATLSANRALAVQLGGLRDPGTRPDGGCTVQGTSTPTGSDTGTPTGGRLSTEATEFLLTLSAEADQVAEYALTCHRWVTGRP